MKQDVKAHLLCFIIGGRELYLDTVFDTDMHYDPSIFLCRDDDDSRWLAVCLDMGIYAVAALPERDAEEVMDGNLPYREALLRQKTCMYVITGDALEEDTVKETRTADLDVAQLPDGGLHYTDSRHYAY